MLSEADKLVIAKRALLAILSHQERVVGKRFFRLSATWQIAKAAMRQIENEAEEENVEREE